jgi:hypothetical protein
MALSDPEKADAFSDSPETQFQPVTVHFIPGVTKMVDVALESYLLSPASEPYLTSPEEVHEAMKGLKPGKTPGPNGNPNRTLKHPPKRNVYLLVLIFYGVFPTH